jgi:esterase
MQLHYQTYGSSGPPLIILHGLFGMLDNWHTVSKMLGAHFEVLALDQRNHGRSPHSREFSYAVMAEDVSEFIHQRGISSANLLGHSMGGKTAMWVALRFPELISRLVVVDIAPRAYSTLHDAILDALTSVDLKHVTSRKEVDGMLSARISDQAVRQFLLKNLIRNEAGVFRWKMNLPILAMNYREVLTEVKTNAPFPNPAMFIRSTKSSYINETDRVDIERLFPNSTIVDFDTGHWVHAEAPDMLSKTVMKFLLDQPF